MYLTKEEEKMLDGEYGPAVQYAMKMLVKYGEIFDAEKMVEIKHAHISCTTWTIEYLLADWLEDLVKMKAKVRVPSSSMITNIDIDQWQELGISKEWYDNQMKLLEKLKAMGIKMELTCTPYFIPWVNLNFGDHVAWCESSAIIYGNSAIGIRTNRECCQSALLAAIAGRTPEFGFHLKENRKGKVLVNVKTKLKGSYDFSIMGYEIAQYLGLRTPVFKGVERASVLDLTVLSAALSTRSGVTMFHIIGATPEAKTEEEAFQGDKPEDKIDFTDEDLRKAHKQFRVGNEKVDYVYIGCPHLNMDNLKKIANLLKGKKVANGVKLIIGTLKALKKIAAEEGIEQIIKDAGGYLISDTCYVAMRHALGYPSGTFVFNCMKQVYYLREGKAYIGNIKECIDAAITGRWSVRE